MRVLVVTVLYDSEISNPDDLCQIWQDTSLHEGVVSVQARLATEDEQERFVGV